jgi:hypothetical protein
VKGLNVNDEYLQASQSTPQLPTAAGQGQVNASERALAQQIAFSQRYPRDVNAARAAIAQAFTSLRLAEQAEYEYPRGGTRVEGASIRAAEALAQLWGRMTFGSQVLSESTGPDGIVTVEVRAFAFDCQTLTNAERSFPVRLQRTVRRSGQVVVNRITDERDAYELVANMASRRERAMILRVIPGDVVDEALEAAETTLRSKVDTSPEAVEKMLTAFDSYGVTRAHIEKFLGANLDTITPRQKMKLTRIWVSLRDGVSRPSNWFDVRPNADTTAADAVRAAAARTPPKQPSQAATASAPPAEGDTNTAVSDAAGDPPAPPAGVDVADMLRRIRAAQNLEELQVLDDIAGELPEGADRAVLVEALTQRDREIASEE